MSNHAYRQVGKSVRKKDSLQLLLGKPVYIGRHRARRAGGGGSSPHANAMVKAIDVEGEEGRRRG